MRKSNAKQRILESARTLMLARGYAGTKVDEICAHASVSKGSFYHFFPTKEALAVAALEAFYLDQRDALMSGEYMQQADAVKRAYGFLGHVELIGAGIWRDGSLLGGFAMEAAGTSALIGASLKSLVTELARVLAQLFEPFAKKGAVSGDALAYHFLSIVEGSVVMARAQNDWADFPAGIRQFRRYLELVAAS